MRHSGEIRETHDPGGNQNARPSARRRQPPLRGVSQAARESQAPSWGARAGAALRRPAGGRSPGGGSAEKSRTSRRPRSPQEAPQRPASARLPASPHGARPATHTCVAAARPSPLRGPAAVPLLRAGEQGRGYSIRADHPARPAAGLPPAHRGGEEGAALYPSRLLPGER